MSDSKTINFHAPIHGPVSTGDHATHGDTIIGNNATLTQNQGIQADLKSLSELLLKLDLGEHQPKVQELLLSTENEAKQAQPNHGIIINGLKETFNLLSSAGKLTKEVQQNILPFYQPIANAFGVDAVQLIKQFLT